MCLVMKYHHKCVPKLSCKLKYNLPDSIFTCEEECHHQILFEDQLTASHCCSVQSACFHDETAAERLIGLIPVTED